MAQLKVASTKFVVDLNLFTWNMTTIIKNIKYRQPNQIKIDYPAEGPLQIPFLLYILEVPYEQLQYVNNIKHANCWVS